MAGFRLTDGSSGCPPTETPPAGYEIPFRFDDAGRLWINGCFVNFRFEGVARHDITTPTILGSSVALLSSTEDIISGDGITAGVYTSLNVTNETACDRGYLVAYDLNADLDVSGTSFAKILLSGRWNGSNIDTVACTSVRTGVANYTRCQSGNAASMHDPGIEAGGSADLVVAAGDSATIGARLFLQYGEGSPDGVDQLHSSGSVVRVYSYVL